MDEGGAEERDDADDRRALRGRHDGNRSPVSEDEWNACKGGAPWGVVTSKGSPVWGWCWEHA